MFYCINLCSMILLYYLDKMWKTNCKQTMNKLVLLCCLLGRVNLMVVEDELRKELPAPSGLVDALAGGVCLQLFYDMSAVTNCRENFASPHRDFTEHLPKLQIRCQTEETVFIRVAPSNNKQLVVLVPDYEEEEGFIDFLLIRPNERKAKVITNGGFTFWTTVLNNEGIPSYWIKGPTVQQWNEIAHNLTGNNYDIKIEMPYKYANNSNTGMVFTWNSNDDSDTCFEVTNNCNTNSAGVITKQIGPDDDKYVLVDNLPLDENCVFTVQGKYGASNLTYQTPSCSDLPKCIPLPEYVKNVSIIADKSDYGEGWDVYVKWSPTTVTPAFCNITLRATDIRTQTVLGNVTEAVFKNVIGHGLYNVSIVTITASGKAHTYRRAIFPVSSPWDDSPGSAVMVGAWTVALLVAVTIALTVICWKRHRATKLARFYFQDIEDKLPKDCDAGTGLDSALPDDRWEVRSERLLLHEVIGEGAFGVVRRGSLAPGGREVAVKMLKDFPSIEEIRSFRAEMELMKSVGAHPHVVSLVGCCSGRRPLIVAEYCSRGDLLSYLRMSWDVMVSKRNAKYYNNNLENSDYRDDLLKNKTKSNQSKIVINKLYDLQGICDPELTSVDLLSFCRQIAMGMEFLASNRVVHRDLAARNVLVSGDRTLKIADFGLSRDVYQENQYKQKGNGKMPVKWMALESLTHRIYTTQSDVWSFGVVVWEVVTVGAAPYPEVPAARLMRLLKAGYRMPRPNNCSKQLYELMLSCWRARPRDRPTFAELHQRLDVLLNSACADEYLSLELDGDADVPPTPKAHRYVKMITRGIRPWTRGESYERPLKAPQTQSNHYTSPPATLTRPQVM